MSHRPEPDAPRAPKLGEIVFFVERDPVPPGDDAVLFNLKVFAAIVTVAPRAGDARLRAGLAIFRERMLDFRLEVPHADPPDDFAWSWSDAAPPILKPAAPAGGGGW